MSRDSANGENNGIEVVSMVQRRRWTAAEKVQFVEEAMQPGMSVSFVARKHGIAPNLLFRWKKLMIEGGKTAVQAEGEVVSKAELKALRKRVNQLERLLGRKTMEVEILREAVGLAHQKKLFLQLPSLMEDGIR